MKLTNVILESFYRVLQVIFKWKTLKPVAYILRAIDCWATFDIQIDIYLAILWEMLRNYTS